MLLFRYLLFFICALTLNCTQAQNLMNIHQGNGTLIQIPLESIDSVRFVTLPPPTIQKIFQSNGNILSIAFNDIDSITYTLPNIASLASLTTQPVSVLSSSSAYSGGTISSDGGSSIIQRGVCWSTSPNPTLANNFSVDGTGVGSFGSNIIPLQSATLYYLRAYAINSEGTAYGNQLSFTTLNPSTSGSLATITTSTVLNTVGLTASCGGNITADGGLAVTARGVCWAIGTTPTINNNITSNGAGGGSFTSTLTNLLPNTSYFVRAYATNDAGTAYGITYSLTTFTLPTVLTNSIISITGLTAISGGNITSDGGTVVTQRGICWSTSPNPTITNNTTSNGSGIGNFTSNMIGLSPSTTYYVRAYAINIVGVYYGNELTFSTIAQLASISTNSITAISINTAISGGNITSDGGAAVTQRGVCWSINPNPTIANNPTSNGSGIGNFTSNMIGLSPLITYYVRAYAINIVGVSYGNEVNFTTIALLASVSTNSITSITTNTAISGGNTTSDGGAAVTQLGVCWSTSPNPSISSNTTSNGIGTGNFTSNMTGLSPSTTYYIRAYAINIVGVSYGNEVSFTTEDIVTNTGAGVSFDGYNYSSIVLGNGQEWMNENLRTTNYANGDPIPNITNNTQWQTLTTGAWTHYNNNSQNEIPYGKLYNWYAASDSRNVCPIGWHVPSNDEWILLVDYLGGLTVAGGKMKSTGTQYWISPNQDATNESGFSALPGGIYTNNFYSIGVDGCWWASTEVPTDSAWLKFIGASGGTLAEGPNFKWFGTSVRCLKD